MIGRALWDARGSLVPTGLALLAFALTGLLHLIAWWSGLLLAPAVLAPVVWAVFMQRQAPLSGSPRVARDLLAALASVGAAWAALAAVFGPLTSPLGVIWLLGLIAAQASWFFVRRSH